MTGRRCLLPILALSLPAILALSLPVLAGVGDYERRIGTAERAAADYLYDFAEKEVLPFLDDEDCPFPDRVLALLVQTAAGRNDTKSTEARFGRLLREHPRSRHLDGARLYYAQALVVGAETSAGTPEAAGALRKAVEHLGLVLRRSGEAGLVSQAEFLLGVIASRSGRPAEAVPYFARALKGDLPALTRSVLALELAGARHALGQYEEALEALPAAIEEDAPEEVRRKANFLAGELHYTLRRWKQARSAYLAAIAATAAPDDLSESAKYCAAWALWKETESATLPAGRPAQARNALEEFLALTRSTSGEVRGRSVLKAGHILILQGEPGRALALLAPLLSDKRFGVQAGYYSALAAIALDDRKAAEKYLKRALPRAKEAPVRAELLAELAGLYEKEERYEEAAKTMEVLAREGGDEGRRWRSLFNAARLALLAGDEDDAARRLEAIAAAEDASRYVPPDEVYYWQARLAEGRAYRTKTSADFLAAERLIKQFLRIGATSERGREARECLLSLYAASPLPEQKERGIAFVEQMLSEAENGGRQGLLRRRAELEADSAMHSRAASTLKAAAALAPEGSAERVELVIASATEHSAAGELSTALSLLEGLEETPERPEVAKRLLLLKADLLGRKGDYAAAADLLSDAASLSLGSEESEETLFAEAQERLRAGQHERARKVLAALKPAKAAGIFRKHYLLADAAFRLGDAEGCVLEAAVALDAAGGDAAREAQALALVGRGRKAQGQNGQAYSLFLKAAERAGAGARQGLLLEAAAAAFAAGMYEEARNAYLEAYYCPRKPQEPDAREHALSGAVEAGLQLLLETKDAAKRRVLLSETQNLLRAAPPSAWKTAALERIRRIGR